jgi:hypothetical protein
MKRGHDDFTKYGTGNIEPLTQASMEAGLKAMFSNPLDHEGNEVLAVPRIECYWSCGEHSGFAYTTDRETIQSGHNKLFPQCKREVH